jgi:hypothetical protein
MDETNSTSSQGVPSGAWISGALSMAGLLGAIGICAYRKYKRREGYYVPSENRSEISEDNSQQRLIASRNEGEALGEHYTVIGITGGVREGDIDSEDIIHLKKPHMKTETQVNNNKEKNTVQHFQRNDNQSESSHYYGDEEVLLDKKEQINFYG